MRGALSDLLERLTWADVLEILKGAAMLALSAFLFSLA